MFRFPFGTVQELNLDWFLEQWEIFKQQAREAFEGIDHALDDEIDRVEDAMTDLYAARDAAIAAKNAAETAEGSTLGYAQSAANSAASAAGSAAGSAQSASSSAGSAEQAAQSAQTSAQQAGSAATSAGNAATSASNASSSAATAATNAGIAGNYSQESAAWATGSYTGDPSLYPVPSTAPQHENNAKYYAESISGDAASAAASAIAAAGSASDAAASAASVSASAEQISTNQTNITALQNAIALALSHTAAAVLPDNVDLDDYIGSQQGEAYIGNFKVTTTAKAQTIANIPEQTAGRLINMSLSQVDRDLQIYITSGSQHIYYRFYTNRGWQAWKQMHVDSTLTIENAPADAKAVGDAIAAISASIASSFDDLTSEYFSLLSGNAESLSENTDVDTFSTYGSDYGNYKIPTTALAQTISHLPKQVPGRLVVMQISQSQRTLMLYIVSGTGEIYHRFYDGSAWSVWATISTGADIDRSFANLVLNIFRQNPFYSHTFLVDISNSDPTTQIIPSESIHDIEISRRLDFDCIEANLNATSDGKYVVIHGSDGKWGYEVEGPGGSDISDTYINANTMAWIKTNVRYKSKYAKYRTAPLEFNEWLKACRANNMIPMFRYREAQNIIDADNIMGKYNYIVYNATRADTDACINYYTNEYSTAATLMAAFENWTPPLIISLGNWSSWTDEDITTVVEWAHAKGFLVGMPGNYLTQSRVQKYLSMGFDFSGSTSNIKAIKDGNLLNKFSDTDFSEFTTTGTVADGVLTLQPGEYIEVPADTLTEEFLSGSTLFLRGSGEIVVNMRSHYMNTFGVTLEEGRDLQVSTLYLEQAPSFRVAVASSASANAYIYSIEYHASKF